MRKILDLFMKKRVQTCYLLALPVDLLLQLNEFLELSDTACLSLCNHALGRALGRAACHSLRDGTEQDDQRRDFLLRLARDYTTCFYCFGCSALHPNSGVRPPGAAILKPLPTSPVSV